jgi:hypothetical protein
MYNFPNKNKATFESNVYFPLTGNEWES